MILTGVRKPLFWEEEVIYEKFISSQTGTEDL